MKTSSRQFPSIESLRLAAGEIDLWTLDLAAGFDQTRFWRLLDHEEQARAGRYRHEISRRRFVLVRGALRWLLGRYLAVEPATLSFILGDKGKPRLSGTGPDWGLVFNVSDSGDSALFALARDTALGVDVEVWRALTNIEGMAARCFSPEEQAYWHGLPEEARLAAFFAFWTCKEAFVKAVGAGLALGLERCVVDLASEPRLTSVPDGCGQPEEWMLIGLDAGPGRSAAVCASGTIGRVRMGDLTARLKSETFD